MGEYYIQLFSPHGLIRYHEAEIGRDRDTGGQVKYVLEMLESLSHHPAVRKVDLFTRRIIDKRVSESYAEEIETINEKARIVRVSCGGHIYRPKESLWDFLDEFVDNTIRFIERQDDFPDVVHGHYADGNYIAGQISETYRIPFMATGHSLGRNKQNILLQEGMSKEKINELFNMQRRIAVEENLLLTADAIIVSTQYIIDRQYSLYENFDDGRFKVIPPGTNTNIFYPFYRLDMPSFKMTIEQEQAFYRVNSEIDRFLFNPAKPLILSIGRADRRKNFETIIQSYGQDKELQAMANLAIFAGVRKDISLMADEEKDLLTNLLLLLDKYDLYGKMAIPKKNNPQTDVPEIYRIAARKKGVFVNATPGENFGLTVVEAAACGLPIIASPTGGPKEILEQSQNGLLVDVENPAAIAEGIKKIIADNTLWEQYSNNGIVATDKHYSWSAFTEKYVKVIAELFETKKTGSPRFFNKSAYGKRLTKASIFIISDLDGTLIDGSNTTEIESFRQWIEEHRKGVVFGVASGRNREITMQAFDQYELPEPEIVICSAGSEIYYTSKCIPDYGWEKHINYQWKRDMLEKELAYFPGITLQEPAAQWPFKISYYVDKSFTKDRLAQLYQYLDEKKLSAKVLLTENKFLDLLPIRASKGHAIRYLSNKWQMPLANIITAGNSGNDIDMLAGKTKGIVVANYSPEMEFLKKKKTVYFSRYPLSKGVLDGIRHFSQNMSEELRDN